MNHVLEHKPMVHILWRIHATAPGCTVHYYKLEKQVKENIYPVNFLKLLLFFFFFSTQAINQAGAGPYSDLVTCRIPASVPEAVSVLSVLEDEQVDAQQLSHSVCLVLNWEEPCNNGAEITSYNIDLGDSSIPVGNVTSYVIKDLLPETSYRWVQFVWCSTGHSGWDRTAEFYVGDVYGMWGLCFVDFSFRLFVCLFFKKAREHRHLQSFPYTMNCGTSHSNTALAPHPFPVPLRLPLLLISPACVSCSA